MTQPHADEADGRAQHPVQPAEGDRDEVEEALRDAHDRDAGSGSEEAADAEQPTGEAG